MVTIIFASACAATSATSAAFKFDVLLPSTSGPTTLGNGVEAGADLSALENEDTGRKRAHAARRQRTAPSRTIGPRLSLSSARVLKVSARRCAWRILLLLLLLLLELVAVVKAQSMARTPSLLSQNFFLNLSLSFSFSRAFFLTSSNIASASCFDNPP